MTFEEAMDAYEAHFEDAYPYSIGLGYPGKTPEENIAIIEECIRTNTPVKPRDDYKAGCIY